MSQFKQNFPVSNKLHQKYYLGQNISAQDTDTTKTCYFQDFVKNKKSSIVRKICQILHRALVKKITVLKIIGKGNENGSVIFISEDGLDLKSFLSVYLCLCFQENKFLLVENKKYKKSTLIRLLSFFSTTKFRIELFEPMDENCKISIPDGTQIFSCWSIESSDRIQIQISLLENPRIKSNRLEQDQWCWIMYDRVESDLDDLQISSSLEGVLCALILYTDIDETKDLLSTALSIMKIHRHSITVKDVNTAIQLLASKGKGQKKTLIFCF